MSELKPCPFCGNEEIKMYWNEFPQCKKCGCIQEDVPARYAVNEWNKRTETETEMRLTDIATKHAVRADELYEALENICSYLSEDGLITNGLSSEIIKAKHTLDQSQKEAEAQNEQLS